MYQENQTKGKILCLTQTLCFRGRWELQWVLPSGIPKHYSDTHIVNTRCGKKNNQYCSRLTLSPALTQHTGSYRCRYRQKERKQTSVYIYVTGKMLQVNIQTLRQCVQQSRLKTPKLFWKCLTIDSRECSIFYLFFRDILFTVIWNISIIV